MGRLTGKQFIGALLLERYGNSKDGYVALYDHPIYGKLIVRHPSSEKVEGIALQSEAPAAWLNFLCKHKPVFKEIAARPLVGIAAKLAARAAAANT